MCQLYTGAVDILLYTGAIDIVLYTGAADAISICTIVGDNGGLYTSVIETGVVIIETGVLDTTQCYRADIVHIIVLEYYVNKVVLKASL